MNEGWQFILSESSVEFFMGCKARQRDMLLKVNSFTEKRKCVRVNPMNADEFFLNIEIEPLEEGGYLATSQELPGLVAQGRTKAETMEIAQEILTTGGGMFAAYG